MSTPLTVADVISAGLPAYHQQYGAPHRNAARAIRALSACRTPAMGGLQYQCLQCGHLRPRYHSCRNRNCPTCQSARRMQWVQARSAELLPVGYFHAVFTLPAQLRPFALRNQAVFYALMFDAVSQTLLELGADHKRLNAQLGFIAILHTWGQNLMDHPHIHCVVPGGGLGAAGKWRCAEQGFLLPVAVMRRLYRGKLLAGFKKALADGRIELHGSLREYEHPARLKALLDTLYIIPWVVYCKPPFGSAEAVIKYLGRYTHRVAISNQRILSLSQGQVSFAYKDYADGDKKKVMTLSAVEFLRRFLMHVVPRGFVRIRHYGFMANRNRKSKLVTCLKLLGRKPPPKQQSLSARPETPPWVQIIKDLSGRDPRICPLCTQGLMVPRCPIPQSTG